jgi:hypothetical protein
MLAAREKHYRPPASHQNTSQYGTGTSIKAKRLHVEEVLHAWEVVTQCNVISPAPYEASHQDKGPLDAAFLRNHFSMQSSSFNAQSACSTMYLRLMM